LGLMLEGKGLKTGLRQVDPKYDCTLDRVYSLELDADDENDLLKKDKQIIINTAARIQQTMQ